MDSEQQSQQFNERLNQWVASQGFWFQLRYSLTGGGKGFHLVGLALRLLVFAVIASVVTGFFLMNRVNSEGFAENLGQRIGAELSSGETRIEGVSRSGGFATIAQLASMGGSETFYSAMRARNVRYRMGLFGGGNPDAVMIARLDVNLHAGAEGEEAAAVISRSLFGGNGGARPSRFEIGDATLRWQADQGGGYGSVENTSMRIQRVENGWRVLCTGGTFTQNWLRDLEIVNLAAVCSPEGIVFETAVFKKGRGSVEFKDLRVRAGAQPQLSGRVLLGNFPLEAGLPVTVRSFVEGSISGGFAVSGSTNTTDGIVLDGKVSLEEGDVIRLRDRLPLLRALSVVDGYNNYRSVEFRSGSFRMRVGAAGMELQDVSLGGTELMTLEGGLVARQPDIEERRQAYAREATVASQGSNPSGRPGDPAGRDPGLNPVRAAGGDVSDQGTGALFDRVEQELDARRLRAREREEVSFQRYQGNLEITLPPDAFGRAPALRESYPGEPGSGRVRLRVPLAGALQELTQEQAGQLYQQGGR